VGEELQRLADATIPPASGDPGMDAEIRSALRCMADHKARSAMVVKAISDGDMRVASAVLRGPSMLSGFSETELAVHRHQYRQKMHPDIVDREKRLKLAIAETERTGASLIKYLKQLADGSDDVAAKHAIALQALKEAQVEGDERI
jgi:hypothetical protein